MDEIWSNLTFENIADQVWGGVDGDLPGNGGPDCAEYIPWNMKVIETVYSLLIFAPMYFYMHKRLPKVNIPEEDVKRSSTNQIILMALSLIFGMEITYKVLTKQIIYLLNPCHMLTCFQLYLLSVPTTQSSTRFFRMTMHWMSWPMQALAFPVTNTLLLRGEVFLYYLQHWFIFIIVPVYLMYARYPIEKMTDWRYAFTSLGWFGIFLWAWLQPLGYILHVNLNCMICPAISDPFAGPYYRSIGNIHQAIAVLIFGKIYSFVASAAGQYGLKELKASPATGSNPNQSLKKLN